MLNEKSVFVVEIPQWASKVKIGKIPVEFYTKADKLPKIHEGAVLKKLGTKTYYVNDKKSRIIKNPLTRGKNKYWNINGQSFYSTNIHWSTRTKIVNFYHKYFLKYIKDQLKEPFPEFLSYKINMHIDIYEEYSAFTPDITNMWILSKMFEDAVVTSKLLRDDSPEFRRKTSYEYFFVTKPEDRKLVVTFSYKKYKDI